jgi:hypothetical protein
VDTGARLYLLQPVSTDLHDLHRAVVQVHKKEVVSGIALFLKYVPWAEHLRYNVNHRNQKRQSIPLQTGFTVICWETSKQKLTQKQINNHG